MPRDLAAAVNDNLRRAFVTLTDEPNYGEYRQFGPLTAASVGVRAPFFNRLFVFEAPSTDDLSAAVGWLAERDVPFLVTATEPGATVVRDQRADLLKAGEQPGMVKTPLETLPAPDPTVDIAEVSSSAELDGFNAVVAAAFEMSTAVVEQVSRAAVAADDVRLFLGRLDGHPAASGLLVQTGDVAGVYWIGVVEAFRRRGIGEAMTWAVLRAGRDAGCRIGALQSSEMGVPLYEAMGFETVVTYHQFEAVD